MPKKENNSTNDMQGLGKFLLYVVIVFSSMLVMFFILQRLAKLHSIPCKFIGNVWLVGSADPNARKGCFTYRELYE